MPRRRTRPSTDQHKPIVGTDVEMLIMIAQGRTRIEIAERLGLKETQVRGRWMLTMSRLGAVNSAHAIALAHKLGALNLDVIDVEPLKGA